MIDTDQERRMEQHTIFDSPLAAAGGNPPTDGSDTRYSAAKPLPPEMRDPTAPHLRESRQQGQAATIAKRRAHRKQADRSRRAQRRSGGAHG